jgi:hypothetical protein
MSAISIDESDWASRARLQCPATQGHTDWQAIETAFYCRTCERTYDRLVDAKTGDLVERSDVTISRRRWGR